MKLLVAIILALSLAACATTRPGTVRTSYDEFTRSTTVHLDRMQVIFNAYAHLTGGPVSMNLTAYRVVSPNLAPIVLILHTESDGWLYLNCYHLNWLIDGTPIPMRTRRERGQVIRGRRVAEYIVAEPPVSVLDRMARAESVRGRLCTTEFELNEEQRAALGDFLVQAKAVLR